MQHRTTALVIVKIADDILMAGLLADKRCFVDEVRNEFLISKATVDANITFSETVMAQNKLGSI